MHPLFSQVLQGWPAVSQTIPISVPEVRPSTNIHIFVQQTLRIVQFRLDFLLSKKTQKKTSAQKENVTV